MLDVISIAFDWPSRSWKGTQISLLENLLNYHDIPTIVIKGDGRRSADGLELWNPKSERWNNQNKILEDKWINTETREQAAHRLARELVVVKNRTLPRLIKEKDKKVGVLLIDRSIISRSIIPTQYNLPNLYNNFSSCKQKILLETITPDLIFCLKVDKNTLLQRLRAVSTDDIKYNARKNSIELNYDRFFSNIEILPEFIQDKIKLIDWNSTIEGMYKRILWEINQYIENRYGYGKTLFGDHNNACKGK